MSTFGQINLVVADMAATVEFYRLLELDVPDAFEWPVGSAAKHIDDFTATTLTWPSTTMRWLTYGTEGSSLTAPPAASSSGSWSRRAMMTIVFTRWSRMPATRWVMSPIEDYPESVDGGGVRRLLRVGGR